MPATRTIPVGVAVVAVLLLAGCALPDGVDGDVTGGWGAMPEPVVFEPEAGTCHRGDFVRAGNRFRYLPVGCEQLHKLETVHVGQFTGEAADRVTPPEDGSPEMVEAYQECDIEAAEYLGADFRHGRLWLGVVRPSGDGWDGGARWFRCDVGVWEDVESRVFLDDHPGSLRDVLADEGSDIKLGCFAPEYGDPDDGIDTMNPVGCSTPHSAEFVGVWTAPDTTFVDVATEDGSNRAHRGCLSVVADYVGVPDDGELRYRTGTISLRINEADWQAGDRGFRCLLWLNDREVSESLKEAGASGLPIT